MKGSFLWNSAENTELYYVLVWQCSVVCSLVVFYPWTELWLSHLCQVNVRIHRLTARWADTSQQVTNRTCMNDEIHSPGRSVECYKPWRRCFFHLTGRWMWCWAHSGRVVTSVDFSEAAAWCMVEPLFTFAALHQADCHAIHSRVHRTQTLLLSFSRLATVH